MKMYVLVNEDVKIGKGKLAGQVGHAVGTFFYRKVMTGEIEKDLLDEYMEHQKKIVLYCSEKRLLELEKEGYITIRDNGLTQLSPNTLTCVLYGILREEEKPEWLKTLKLV